MTAQTTYMVRLSDGQEFGPASIDMITEWARQGRVPIDALLVPSDGSAVRSVLSEPSLRTVLQAPPTAPTGPVTAPTPASGLNVMIPTRNPCALTGYYISVASLIPCLGFLGLVAIVLGIMGLRARLKRPEIHGLAHAWVAIILGSLVTLGNLAVVAIMIANQ